MNQYIKFLGYLSWIGIVAIAVGVCSELRQSGAEASFVSEAYAADRASFQPSEETEKSISEIIPVVHDGIQTFLVEHGGFVLEHSKELKLDYRLVLAVIKQESGFDREAVSHRGAFGFMQIMPETFATEGADVPHYLVPEEQNLFVGMNYLRALIRHFSRIADRPEDAIALALAAYNAGPSRVHDAQELCRYREESAGAWRSVAESLPVLADGNESLHDSVWNAPPPSGRFNGSTETLGYVENVLAFYQQFKRTLPTVE